MYLLKQTPEDFIVEEQNKFNFLEQGKYTIFTLKKINYTTEDAIQKISSCLKLERKKFGYAGIKDRNAITTQYISIENGSKKIEELTLKDIELNFEGYLQNPITLGSLTGNNFKITIRNLEKNAVLKEIKHSINYFDKQRFSGNNSEIGKSILKKKFKEACELIIQHEGSYKDNITRHLENNKNDYINALRKIPRKILMIYIHAYQSKIWNETVKEYLKKQENDKLQEIPIIGFSTEIENTTIKEIITKIMEQEQITFRDFIIRELPELSFEGNQRPIHVEIKNLKIENKEKDELNQDKYKIKVEFFLEKGAYATMAIRQMLE